MIIRYKPFLILTVATVGSILATQVRAYGSEKTFSFVKNV